MPNPPSSKRRRIGDLVLVDGHDVHVRQDGPEDAPAVVLVHGFACSMHWFDQVAAELAAEHRVIRVDLLGHGCTSAATNLDAAAQARAMSSVLQRLGTNAATAVGHSFGADVVLAMAQRTDQIARVVIIAQAPDYNCSGLPSIAFLPGLPTLATLTHRLTPPWMARICSRVGFTPGHQPDHGSDDGSDDPRRVALDRAAMNPRMYRTILADFCTGMRKGEALALHWADVDLDDRLLFVRYTLSNVNNTTPVFTAPKTKSSCTWIGLSPRGVRALRRQAERQRLLRLANGPSYQDQDLVFTRRNGQPLRHEYVLRHLRQLTAAADLPRIRVHDLRHFAATTMLSSAVPLAMASKTMRHSTLSTTTAVYGHLLRHVAQQAVEAIDTALTAAENAAHGT